MSDMTNDLDDFDYYDEWSAKDPDPFKTVRKRGWVNKSGDVIRICDMTDKHLLNAFNLTKDETLFREMVWRLFEKRVKEVKP